MVKPRTTKVRKHRRNKPVNHGDTNVNKHLRTLSFNRRGNPVLSSDTKPKSIDLNATSLCLNIMINSDLNKLLNSGISEKQAMSKLCKSYGNFPVHKYVEVQRGYIADLAKKAHLGFKHAIEWERKHLPSQVKWIREEYKEAKRDFKKAYNQAKDTAKFLRNNIRDFAVNASARDEIDQLELDRERDVDEDGTPDVPKEAFNFRNATIRSQISKIDTNNDGLSDKRQLMSFTDTEDKDNNGIPDKKEKIVKSLLEKGSLLSQFLKEKKQQISIRKDLVKLEQEAPVSFLLQELQKSPSLILDLPDNKLKELAIRMPKSASFSIPFIQRGFPSPTGELEKRRFRRKDLERRGF